MTEDSATDLATLGIDTVATETAWTFVRRDQRSWPADKQASGARAHAAGESRSVRRKRPPAYESVRSLGHRVIAPFLGQYDTGGKFVCAGFCGTALSEDTRAVAFEELKATRRKTCPFPTVPVLRDHFHELPDTPPQWVRPSIVVEVEYRQQVKDGLRHAALKGIRPEKL